MRHLCLFCLFLLICQITGCATKSVTLKTDGPADVSLVGWDDLEAQGESLGKTPVTLEVEKLTNQVVKISATGKAPQFWVFNEMLGDQLEAKVKLAEIPARETSPNASTQALADANETHRLLMKAYQALAGGELDLAKDLSAKLAELAPRVAAPLIISGLASMRQGDKKAARSAFVKAKSLDPKDSDIDKLLQAVQP